MQPGISVAHAGCHGCSFYLLDDICQKACSAWFNVVATFHVRFAEMIRDINTCHSQLEMDDELLFHFHFSS